MENCILYIDIFQYIFNSNFLDTWSEISLMRTCRELYSILKIKSLTCNENVTENILKQRKFNELEYLDVSDNMKIRSVSYLKYLKKLNISGPLCKINKSGLIGLKLEYLDVSDNDRIKDVSYMKTLRYLIANGDSGINQNGISGLTLIGLDAGCNKKIKNLSFMKSLRVLNASGNCGIDKTGIEGLSLDKLIVYHNKKFI